ncbi:MULTISPECIES: glycosyltransferase family 2 protein [unclassified Methanoregula]|uniref:glycosyltransferase family 2 protein n=1 Tax=unclassified Methanoregula TaxID=2649730 RepID=UPI0009D5F2AE|nr:MULTISPECIES: glycosyltransferase family 2 protein [unclassified Methanoregula]OPX65124.1 MAG: Glycosyltransferase AglJ [Methanoregula sp. PtaB.Bin085]OPY32036.1 MAG: Glycosyltransferase AglJ [Methanoregula sp. PtaU1.Bin006]
MKLIITIPAYNEEKSVGAVIRGIPEKIEGIDEISILVINDGSLDRTAEEAKQAGADRILSHTTNMGLAVSFRDGLNESLAMGADIIVNIDADLQYNCREIPHLIKPILERRAEIVLGDRQIDKISHMPRGNLWGNKIATGIIRMITGLPIRDAQTGFRAFSRDAAARIHLTGDYTYTQETLIQAANKKIPIAQIPVEFHRRGDSSRLISSIFQYARYAGITLFRSVGTYHPFMVFMSIGLGFIVAGLVFGFRVIAHFFNTGLVTPYLPSALLTTVLLILGGLSMLFALLADMNRTQRMLSEEILYRLKK